MGCVLSPGFSDLARCNQIDDQIERDRSRMMAMNEIKILLLGHKGSGKSTLLKRMKLIHSGYTDSDRGLYRKIIFSNAIQHMRSILEALPDLGIALRPENDPHCTTILSLPSQTEHDILPPDVYDAIRTLWLDPGIQESVRRSSEISLDGSAVYYLESIDRIAAPEYRPTDQDILLSRSKATGITETTFQVGESTYNFLDISGQRGYRKKWMHCFEQVTALLFLVGLSDYDQVSLENEGVNQVQDTLTLFDSICDSRWFANTPVIILLNKTDLFAEKLHYSPPGNYFPNYQGGSDYDAACEYFLHRAGHVPAAKG